MKRLFLLPIIALCMIGCQKNSDIQENELIEVGFNCSMPSISFDSEPLVQTRAYTDEPRYIVQVYLNDEPYAYGVFNDITSQKIIMENGETYNMRISYFPNGHYGFVGGLEEKLTDGFVYSVERELSPDNHFLGEDGYLQFIPSIKYYADNVKYTASSNANINVNLEAWVFGLSFKVKNLIKGSVKIVSPKMFEGRIPSLALNPNNTEYEAVYSMRDWGVYTYTPYVLITYVNDAGVESKIYEGELPIARLKKTIVNINLKPVSNESESSFSVDLEQYSITDGETLNLNQE